jgi:hypothetical protein
MGFIINPETGDILEPPPGNRIIIPQALSQPLKDALLQNGVSLLENFDLLSRYKFLFCKLCIVSFQVFYCFHTL